jgi:hypothetical protein
MKKATIFNYTFIKCKNLSLHKLGRKIENALTRELGNQFQYTLFNNQRTNSERLPFVTNPRINAASRFETKSDIPVIIPVRIQFLYYLNFKLTTKTLQTSANNYVTNFAMATK